MSILTDFFFLSSFNQSPCTADTLGLEGLVKTNPSKYHAFDGVHSNRLQTFLSYWENLKIEVTYDYNVFVSRTNQHNNALHGRPHLYHLFLPRCPVSAQREQLTRIQWVSAAHFSSSFVTWYPYSSKPLQRFMLEDCEQWEYTVSIYNL